VPGVKTRWVIVAMGDAGAGAAEGEVQPARSAVLTCPQCARGVRAFARSLRRAPGLVVFACPCCGALLEETPWAGPDVPALPGATLHELKAAVAQAAVEAERWRCQADGARQREDHAWAAQAVAWATAAEQRLAALQWQAASLGSEQAAPAKPLA
jgi:hypothetical protein